MTKRELFVKAHEMTREIVKENGVNYKAQFGICLSFLYKGENKMIELEGTEKQVKWAKAIIKKKVSEIEERIIFYKSLIKKRTLVGASVPKRYSRKIEELNSLKDEVLNCTSAYEIINTYANINVEEI